MPPDCVVHPRRGPIRRDRPPCTFISSGALLARYPPCNVQCSLVPAIARHLRSEVRGRAVSVRPPRLTDPAPSAWIDGFPCPRYRFLVRRSLLPHRARGRDRRAMPGTPVGQRGGVHWRAWRRRPARPTSWLESDPRTLRACGREGRRSGVTRVLHSPGVTMPTWRYDTHADGLIALGETVSLPKGCSG